MRFDPQANFLLPELRASSFETPVPQVLAARSPLKTALVILAVAFVVGGGMWFWSDGVPGQMKAYGALPMEPESSDDGKSPSAGTAALIEYAQVVMSNRSGEEKLAAVTGRSVDAVEAGKQARKKARLLFEAGNEALAMNKYGEAIKHFLEAINLEPNMAAAHYRLGLAYVRIGNKEAARSEHAALVTLDKDLANLLVNLVR